MRIFIFLFAATALLLNACQDAGSSRQMTTDGYEYVVHADAEGEPAEPGEYVFFHAQIRKGDSVVYSTRVSNPQMPFLPIPMEGAPSQQGSPIETVLATMSVGDSCTLYVPVDSLPQTPPDFAGEENMIYDIVLMEIKTQEEFMNYQQERQAAAAAATAEAKEKIDGIMERYRAGELDSQTQETGSGLSYVVLEAGNGPTPEAGDQVSVDYYGMLAEGGEMFDNSFSRGFPFTFTLGQGQVISGWDEGIAQLSEGSEAMLFLPSVLGYGAAGSPPSIPADADLIFYVKLVEVDKAQ